jgi:hypothetical protein
MKSLYDFANDPAFNHLKQSMGAKSAGQFQAFDPRYQLTWDERQQLAQQGLVLACDQLRSLKDNTLALKDSRVWVVHQGLLHIASCSHIQALRRQQGSALCGTGVLDTLPEICPDCLQQLNYLGMDARRARRMAEHISQMFCLSEYQRQFPFYPV